MTAYGRVALAGADIVVPDMEGELGAQVRQEAEALCAPRRGAVQHRLIEIPSDGLLERLRAAEAETGVRLSTMRRGPRGGRGRLHHRGRGGPPRVPAPAHGDGAWLIEAPGWAHRPTKRHWP